MAFDAFEQFVTSNPGAPPVEGETNDPTMQSPQEAKADEIASEAQDKTKTK